MEKTKLYPPPWTWEYHPDTHEAIALTSPSGDVLLATGDERYSWLAAGDLHMRALAATPDLLEACQLALKNIMAATGYYGGAAGPLVTQLRAAIAKATGEHS